jgi:hypothetical protein
MMRLSARLLVALLLPLLPAVAAAQMRPPQVGQAQQPAPQREAPPALPGTAGRAPAPVIPADPDRGVLSPNAALFDAINRNDLAAARDAVARGASLSARNVLGLTPIEAAVDQGRSEIVFFLLQARATDPSLRPRPEAERSAPRPTAPAPAAAVRAIAAPAAPAAPQRPRLFANDGGTPQPDIGFLGFDLGGGRR